MKIVADVLRKGTKWKQVEESKLKNAVRAVNRGALKIHGDIIRSFVTPKGGNIYERGGKEHTASAPGEAPARDSGHLGQSTTFKLAPLNEASTASVAQVNVNAEYALALEFGREDGSIAPRPFVRPAFEANKDQIREDIKKALAG